MIRSKRAAVLGLMMLINGCNTAPERQASGLNISGPLPAGTTLTLQSFWPRDLGVSTDGAPKAIEWIVTAPDTALQNAAGEILKHKLAAYTGVHSVTSSMQPGKPELHLELKPAAAFYGLTMRDLSEQVRHGFFGLEVQRYYHEHDEIRVMLRFPREDRRTLAQLQAMPIRLPDGSRVPFDTIARGKYRPEFASIQRTDRERIQLIGARIRRMSNRSWPICV